MQSLVKNQHITIKKVKIMGKVGIFNAIHLTLLAEVSGV